MGDRAEGAWAERIPLYRLGANRIRYIRPEPSRWPETSRYKSRGLPSLYFGWLFVFNHPLEMFWVVTKCNCSKCGLEIISSVGNCRRLAYTNINFNMRLAIQCGGNCKLGG